MFGVPKKKLDKDTTSGLKWDTTIRLRRETTARLKWWKVKARRS